MQKRGREVLFQCQVQPYFLISCFELKSTWILFPLRFYSAKSLIHVVLQRHVEEGVLRLRQEGIVPIALPTRAWFWLWQNISPTDSAVGLLSRGADGSPRAWQGFGDVWCV